MKNLQAGRWVGFGSILILAIFLLSWSYTPGELQQVELAQPPVSFSSFTMASRPIRLEMPRQLRRGAVNVLQLKIGASSTEDGSTVLAEARLELPGVQIQPGSIIETAMAPGTPVTFEWQIRTGEIANPNGTLWIHYSHAGERHAVLAFPLIFSERRLFGLGVPVVRWLGWICGLIGMVGLLLTLAHGNRGKE